MSITEHAIVSVTGWLCGCAIGSMIFGKPVPRWQALAAPAFALLMLLWRAAA